MRDVTWIYAVVIFLSSEARSGVTVVRHVAFIRGSEVNLTCSNKTWNDMIFVIWNITLQTKKNCQIGYSNGKSVDFCKDGKSLRNTSSALSYLHISKFSDSDEGLYKCHSVYKGGIDHYAIHVAIIVPPSTSAWLDRKDNKMVAVCRAERGKPAASITWSLTGNISSKETSSNGFFTVESRLELLEGMDTENLSCVIRHQNSTEKIMSFALKHEKGYPPWLYVLIVGVIIVLLAGFVFFAQKKIITLRRCRQSDTSASKWPPAEDVEEVEPYASYVQRENSIYNSSADLTT
ncbi:cell surface glycoprotein CD200 receptor 1-B isoform X2 [Cyclopterus lumpus]|uniref:cell surface glycoprotein CD200 receptor 1-B isoform X2 n=1 Tax=Cyclopterus lumpus TaxID=8103 RepID=UPI001486E63D|nr:cell surface glycoprotein CD200 receptor 1-B isoform X2 [Cyclopterus lumpus]XP_034417232.1 cell surface glycoprotein CD200 receptor 1-B isoform X2 [Cyclopterus lumpus]XP_034417233.1 cell surface glycoprotein CD200 receptor 1-B isoform X2 [Cyclopterus lumpus]